MAESNSSIAAHYPWPDDHLHWYKVNQEPYPACKGDWNKDKSAGPYDETEPIIPKGAVPVVPPGAVPLTTPFPVLTPN